MQGLITKHILTLKTSDRQGEPSRIVEFVVDSQGKITAKMGFGTLYDHELAQFTEAYQYIVALRDGLPT